MTNEHLACASCGTLAGSVRPCCWEPRLVPAQELITKLWTLAYARETSAQPYHQNCATCTCREPV